VRREKTKEMAGPRFEDDSLPVRAAVFASGRTALMSTASVSTPDHLRGATLASVVPASVFQESRCFGAEDHNDRWKADDGRASPTPPSYPGVLLFKHHRRGSGEPASFLPDHQLARPGNGGLEMERSRMRQPLVSAFVLVAGLGLSTAAFAEHFHGVVSGRAADGTLTVQSDDSSDVNVVIADATKVRQADGMHSKKVTAASLIPGLRVDVNGRRQDGNRFVADRVTFKKSDLKIARAIQSGLGPIDARVAANEQKLAIGEEMLRQQQATLQQQRQQIAANDAKIVATSGMADANAVRISNLDDYDIIGSYTVYFANGKSTVPSKSRHGLEHLIAMAKDLRGYVVQVQGYASAVGSDALNEQLSTDRAVAVTRILQENGIPPTSIAPPAGMGVTSQVAPNKTQNGQAQNRRAVITVLQNKGISGK
jgi:outer membrane protein OmpA-like peptidoglycan-associated protein